MDINKIKRGNFSCFNYLEKSDLKQRLSNALKMRYNEVI